jgi:long-subunit acyl-CoA synthetase (AMP-forming)
MAAAPRIFEKVYSRVVTGAAESAAKKKIFDWAVGVGNQVVRAQQEDRTPGRMLAAQQQIADKLVFQQAAGPLRWAPSLLHQRQCGAVEGHRRVLHGRRRPGPRGLRA